MFESFYFDQNNNRRKMNNPSNIYIVMGIFNSPYPEEIVEGVFTDLERATLCKNTLTKYNEVYIKYWKNIGEGVYSPHSGN